MEIKPIAYIHTGFKEKFGIPRQSGRVEELTGRIVFEPEYRAPEAFREIAGFSHLWLIFDFSLSHRDKWSPTVRPPRLGGNRRVGVFASRSPFRPNPLGLSCVKLISVEHTDECGPVLVVGGVDLLDMTPILDVKPYLPFADCVPDAVGGYADSESMHRLSVTCPPELSWGIPGEVLTVALHCIADDPRPSYIDDPERVYSMEYGGYTFDFTVTEESATVVEVRSACGG